MPLNRPILTIDLTVIRNNYLSLKKLAPNAKISAVMKADCYGLGAKKIAPVLEQAGCSDFFVSSLNEGIELRKQLQSEANIYILNGINHREDKYFVNNNLIPVLCTTEQVDLWTKAGKIYGKKLPAILHFDSGMHRLAIPQSELTKILSLDLGSIDIRYIMSHLIASERHESPINKQQLDILLSISKHFKDTKRSIANSGAVFLGSEFHLDLIRSGAAIYGSVTHPDAARYIQNPLKLSAPIIQIQNVPKGGGIGYSSNFIADRDMRIATIPVGYADGYLRSLSSNSKVIIAGHDCRIVGNISMDLSTIDISHLPENECYVGQEVFMLNDQITCDDLAKNAGTLGYEVMTSLGQRYNRIYL